MAVNPDHEIQTGGYTVLRVPEGGFTEVGNSAEARDHKDALDDVLPDDAEGAFIALPTRTYKRARDKAVKITIETRPVRTVEQLELGG